MSDSKTDEWNYNYDRCLDEADLNYHAADLLGDMKKGETYSPFGKSSYSTVDVRRYTSDSRHRKMLCAALDRLTCAGLLRRRIVRLHPPLSIDVVVWDLV